jgi:hypothetical protein
LMAVGQGFFFIQRKKALGQSLRCKPRPTLKQ